MTTLLDKNREVLRRMENPQPIADRLRAIFEEGKREQLLAGVDADGNRFAPLKPSTLKKPRLDLDPLVPQGPGSDIVTRYEVAVSAEMSRLVIRADWPGLDWVRYHQSGTSRMARRDPGGFRAQDRQLALDTVSRFIHGPGLPWSVVSGPWSVVR